MPTEDDCCGCGKSLCCGGRNLTTNLLLTLLYPGTSAVPPCGDSVLTLTKVSASKWTATGTVLVEVPDAGGEACVPITAFFEFYCDPAGPVYEMKWRFEYLGNQYPSAGMGIDPDEFGTYWCGLIRTSQDCTCPFLGVWSENEACGIKFWNSFFTFLVEEPSEVCP